MPYIPPYLPGNPMMPYQNSQQYAQYDQSLAYQQMQQNNYNPYQWQQNPNLQQNKQNIQQQSKIAGRFVSGPEEIAVNEVDMNGSVSIFPTNNMSCIYAKQWTADGKIQTVKYIPMHEEQPTNDTQSVAQASFDYGPFMERFDRLEQLLTPKSTNSRAKKGDSDNE